MEWGAWCWSCVWNGDWDYPDETVFVELSVSILDKNHTETFRDVYTQGQVWVGVLREFVIHRSSPSPSISPFHSKFRNTHTHKTHIKHHSKKPKTKRVLPFLKKRKKKNVSSITTPIIKLSKKTQNRDKKKRKKRGNE